MKLRNKKTGEIVEVCKINPEPFEAANFNCSNLAELEREWEDYEEPKGYYFIRDNDAGIGYSPIGNSPCAKCREVIGNRFETGEEAEKAVEKLKAWKRLKGRGFRFDGWEDTNGGVNNIWFTIPEDKWETDVCDDLNLLFNGGEE